MGLPRGERPAEELLGTGSSAGIGAPTRPLAFGDGACRRAHTEAPAPVDGRRGGGPRGDPARRVREGHGRPTRASGSPSAAPRSASPATGRCSSRSRRGARGATPRGCCSGSPVRPGSGSTPSVPGSGRAASAGRRRQRSAPARTPSPGSPSADVPVGSYVMRLTIEGNGGRRVYGGRRPASPERASAPVVRVLGIEAAFSRRSYLPTEPMAMRVLADVPSFTLTFLRVGHGPDPSLRNDEMVGLEMGDPVRIDWTGKRSTRQTIAVQIGRLAERALRGPPRVGRRPRRVRPVRPPRQDTGPAAGRGRPPDEHLAGVQPLRRRRRRLGGHVVRRRPAARRCSTARSATAACRRGSAATTSRSSAGSRRPAATPTS